MTKIIAEFHTADSERENDLIKRLEILENHLHLQDQRNKCEREKLHVDVRYTHGIVRLRPKHDIPLISGLNLLGIERNGRTTYPDISFNSNRYICITLHNTEVGKVEYRLFYYKPR